MSTLNASGYAALRSLALAASLVGLVAGCQVFGGGGGGVMPATDVGLPPSLRGTIPGREARNANVDADGQPLQAAPTKAIVLPKTAASGNRTADAGERRIRRDELEGSSDGRSIGGSVAPTLTPGGSVGLGGKF